MSYEEFVSRLPEGSKKPSSNEFVIINLVYGCHPCIRNDRGKDQIAELYIEYGMRIIYDMRETAKRAGEIEDDIRRKRQEIEELEREYKELAMR